MAASVYGNAAFQRTHKELDAAGLLADKGIILGTMQVTDRIEVPPEKKGGFFAGPTQPTFREEISITHARYDGEQHLMLVSPTRTGKGTTVIVPTLLTDTSSFIATDPKGQNAAICFRRRTAPVEKGGLGQLGFCLNPFGEHIGPPWNLPQHSFNPLDPIDPNSKNFVAEISALCEALIKTESERDPHWANAARDLVSGLLIHIKTAPGEIPTLPRMRELLALPEEEFQKLIGEILQRGHPVAKSRIARFLLKAKEENREVQGVLSDALTQTSFLDDPAIASCMEGSDFDFEMLKEQPVTVFIIIPDRFMEAYSRWTRLIFQSAVDAMMATVAGHPVVGLFDESYALMGRSRLPIIEHAAAGAAGRGFRMMTVWQDLNQTEQVFGKTWATLMGNSGVTQFFTPNDKTTAEYLSARLGDYTTTYENRSIQETSVGQANQGFSGISHGQGIAARPLAFPHELYGFPKNESLVFLSGQSDAYRVHRAPYYETFKDTGWYDPDPYHLPASMKTMRRRVSTTAEGRQQYQPTARNMAMSVSEEVMCLASE